MDIRHFVTFKKIAELNNFTKAADTLGYAQSSVTAHINIIESELGVAIFDRIGKGIQLTQEGKQLLKHVNELLDVYENIIGISNTDLEPKGIIKIGVPESLLIYRLDGLLKTYKELFPKVTIILENTPSKKLIQSIKNGDIDMTFILDHEVKDPDIKIHNIIKEEMCIVKPQDCRFQSLEEIPDDMAIFLTEKGCSYRYIFEQLLKQNNVPMNNVMETWSIETIKKCVINGFGIAFLPRIIVEKELIDNKLKLIPYKEIARPIYSQVAYNKRKWLSPALKEFLKLTQDLSRI